MLNISVSCQQVLEEDGSTDLALVAEIAAIPSEAALSDAIAAAGAPVDPVAVHRNRSELAGAIGSAMRDRLRGIYDAQYAAQRAQQLDSDTGSVAVGRRAIANLALRYLMAEPEPPIIALAVRQFTEAQNMTNELAALTLLVATECPEREVAISTFERKWSEDQLVLQSWFSVQAICPLDGTLARVKELMQHPKWDKSNGNMIGALIQSFVTGNAAQFHTAEGYEFLGDFIIEVDAETPSRAAGLTRLFTVRQQPCDPFQRLIFTVRCCGQSWTRFDAHRQGLMKAQLLRIRNRAGVSANTFEVADKILAVSVEAEVAVEAA